MLIVFPNLRRSNNKMTLCPITSILGQMPPRKICIEPRRMDLPKDFASDWKKIGYKRKRYAIQIKVIPPEQ